MADDSIDPYKLFKLRKDFNLDQLRASYKRLAIAVHPDKPSGSEYLFKQITACYKSLARDFERRQSDKTYFDLKGSYNDYAATQETERRRNVQFSTGTRRPPSSDDRTRGRAGGASSAPRRGGTHASSSGGGGGSEGGDDYSGKNFNRDKFNRLFTEHRSSDAHDHGYGDWMASSSKHREDIDIKNVVGKYSEDAFHSAFERIKVPKERAVAKYKEPEALPLTRSVQFSELGVAKIDDFGDKLSSKELSFSDYRRAHTTGRLIDVDSVMRSRTRYNSVDHLETERENISYEMDERTQRIYDRRKRDVEVQENARVQHQMMQDRLAEKQYKLLNRLMLST